MSRSWPVDHSAGSCERPARPTHSLSKHAATCAVPMAVLLLLAANLSACNRSRADKAAAPPLVRTVVVADATSPRVAYTGVVRARVEADLGFRVPGKIVERLVDPGQSVRRGQPLMRIDATDLALASSAADQRLRSAEADAVRAAADEKRFAVLVQTSAVSRATYDNALAAQRSTAANLEAARAAAQQAANEKSYALLVADADGLVTDVLAQPGQVVEAGTPVVKLARNGAREALVSVPETALGSLSKTGVARVYGAAAPAPVTLREVAGSADPLTRTFAARFVLEGAGGSAPLGATVTVELAPGGTRTIAVPLAALHDGGNGPGVWVIGPSGQVSFRRVDVLSLGEEQATLADGALRPGERLVALGAQLLQEGERVRVAPADL